MKMEIELTDEQAEKVQILKENGIEVGEAIEMFFQMRNAVSQSSNLILDRRIQQATEERAELEEKLAKVDRDLSFYGRIKDSSLDITQKQKLLEKEYGISSKTYDETVMDAKHRLKWSNFFKF